MGIGTLENDYSLEIISSWKFHYEDTPCADRLPSNERPLFFGKKWVEAPEKRGGVGVQKPVQGL